LIYSKDLSVSVLDKILRQHEEFCPERNFDL